MDFVAPLHAPFVARGIANRHAGLRSCVVLFDKVEWRRRGAFDPHGPASRSAAEIVPGSRQITARLDRKGASPSARRVISDRNAPVAEDNPKAADERDGDPEQDLQGVRPGT